MNKIAIHVGWPLYVVIAMSCCTITSCGPADEGADGQIAQVGEAQKQDLFRDPEYMQVPGFRVHRSCVHEVPDGAEASKNADGTVSVHVNGRETARIQRCGRPSVRTRALVDEEVTTNDVQPPVINGWVMSLPAFAPSNSGRDWFNRIAGSWRVPHNPPTNGALIFIFNSLTSSGNQEILQPVLQYGSNGGFGGNYWVIASWWAVDTDTYLYSTPRTVSFNTEIRGVVNRQSGTCNSSGICSWTVSATTSGTSSTLNVASSNIIARMRRADAVVLEVYAVDSCTDLPDINEWVVGYGTYSNYVYRPPPTGDLNGQVEIYTTATWTETINSTSPSCLWGMNSSPPDRLVTMGWKWW